MNENPAPAQETFTISLIRLIIPMKSFPSYFEIGYAKLLKTPSLRGRLLLFSFPRRSRPITCSLRHQMSPVAEVSRCHFTRRAPNGTASKQTSTTISAYNPNLHCTSHLTYNRLPRRPTYCMLDYSHMERSRSCL
jgi:hypothetical protein